MRRLMLVWAALVALLFLAFVVVEAVGVPLLSDPGRGLHEASLAVAVVGQGLLVADAVLPVASSAVMVLHGAAFGVVGGTTLSTLGSLGSLALAWWIGRRGRGQLELMVAGEGPRLAHLVQRYGAAAIVASRPVPLLAESIAFVAGATGIACGRTLLSGLIGIVPISLLYALAGAHAGQAGGVAVAGVVIGLALVALAVSAISHRADITTPLRMKR